MFLIAGLGNPGEKYKKTRHNLGFLVVEELLRNYESAPRLRSGQEIMSYEKKHDAEILKTEINKQTIILAKPQTFMNNSGQAVSSLARYYKIKPESIWIIHDDIDLPLDKIRISKSASAGGHKGVQSIIDHLGTKDFIRFRIGIKPAKDSRVPAEKFVLQKFTKTEEKTIQKSIQNTVEAIALTLEQGFTKAMNKFN